MTQKIELYCSRKHRRILLSTAEAGRSDGRGRHAAALSADGLVRGDLLLEVLYCVLVLDLLLLQEDDLEPALLQDVPQGRGLGLAGVDVLVCEPGLGLEGLSGTLKSV